MNDQLKIEYIPIGDIKLYKNNAKLHPKEQIAQIKKSIKEFGFDDPIAVWKDNIIIEGHGRLLAAQELGLKEIPIIRLDGLTDEQRRAYTLVHNQLTMNSGFDIDMLNVELGEIEAFDMSGFGFEFEAFGEDPAEVVEDDYDEELPEEPQDDRDPSCQHNVFENQDFMQFTSSSFYGMPVIRATKTVGDKFLRFMDWKEIDDPENYIAHFYYDDYKFISAWREPEKYIERLKKFKACVSPDFSLYTDFPRALQILSCYRRQWCGAYWQSLGIDVIPDIVWGDEESFDYCFDGIPMHSTVAVSTVGVKLDAEWNGKKGSLFKRGYDEMLKRLKPTTILFYGDMIEGLDGNIISIPSYYAERRKNWKKLAK